MIKCLFQFVAVLSLKLLLGCGSPSSETTNVRKAPALVDTPRSFVMNYGVNDDNLLFAFVGEKVSIEQLPSRRNSFDYCFKAKYLVLKKVYGSFSKDTIEFIAYDHYGEPAFSKFNNVLLFVSADSGTYYHQKYIFNDVYRTKNGRWAGTYASDDYKHAYNKHTRIRPEKIEFTNKVSFPIKMVDEDGQKLEFSYPMPYFKRVGDSAFAVYGIYVEDLVILKIEGVLTARELFRASAQQQEEMVESSQPEPRKTPLTKDDLKFLAFWEDFVASLDDPGLKNFKHFALDTLYVCDQLLPVDRFIEKCFNQVIDNEVRRRIVDKTKVEYDFKEVDEYGLLTSQVKIEILKTGDGYWLREMLVTRSTKNNNPPIIYFDFIETKKGYRLYAISHHWFKDCCK